MGWMASLIKLLGYGGFGGNCSKFPMAAMIRFLAVDLTYAFLLANDFDLVANFVSQVDGSWHGLDQNERRRGVRCIQLHVLDSDQSVKKRLSRLESRVGAGG
jgi:hypothetical protein